MGYSDPDEGIGPEELRNNLSMIDLIEALDDVFEWPGWRTGGVKIPTVFHEERTPSLHIYEDHWHCYATGKGGDVIAFYRAVTGKGFRAAMADLTKLYEGLELNDVTLQRNGVKVQAERPVVDFSERLQRESMPDLWRISDEMDAKWGPGVADKAQRHWGVRRAGSAIWIPHYHHGRVTGIHVRDLLSGAKFSVKGSRFSEGLYAPPGMDWRKFPVLFLAEGEPDAWVASLFAERHSIGVAGLPNGAGVVRPEWFEKIATYQIYFFADTDPSGAGQKAAAAVVDVAPCEVTVVSVPDEALDEYGKGDLASAYAQGHILEWADTPALLNGDLRWS